MELIPKAVVAGLFQGQVVNTGSMNMLLQAPGTQAVTRDTINRIWSDVVKQYPYQSLQLEASGTGAIFVGEGGLEDAVVIQPPLVQVRALLVSEPQGVPGAAQKIAFIVKTALHQLGGPPPLNLGVKLVYHAPAPGQAAVDFLRTELIKGDEDLLAMAGSRAYSASLKVVMTEAESTHTLLIEPLHADPRYLFIDIDSQFSGVVDTSHIADRISSVNDFVANQVRNFLERRAGSWAT